MFVSVYQSVHMYTCMYIIHIFVWSTFVFHVFPQDVTELVLAEQQSARDAVILKCVHYFYVHHVTTA